jgi:hypothetical protein
MQLPDFRSVYGCCGRPTQTFPVLPRMRQTGPSSFSQNLPFELSENRQQTCHRATGRGGQIQCLGQRNEANAEMT